MKVNNLEEAFVEELRDVFSAEKQISRALPQMAKKACHPQLKAAFEEHLEQTKAQIERLERAFEMLNLRPRASRCEGMVGIIQEGREVLHERGDDDARDAMMIAAAQKVEHYEIATYGTLCEWAKTLRHDDIGRLLHQTLDEEKAADGKLTELAKSQMNIEATGAL